MMQLTKTVPKHTVTQNFLWCKKDWITNDPTFRSIRSGAKNKMDNCFWCKYKFKNGEWMSLAARDKGSNVVLCATCANILLESKNVNGGE